MAYIKKEGFRSIYMSGAAARTGELTGKMMKTV